MSVKTSEQVSEVLEVINRTNAENTFAGYGEKYYTQIHRERIKLKSDGTIHERVELPSIQRMIDAVAEETVTLDDGTVLTHAQVDEAKSKFSDKWEAEDTSKNQPPNKV